jgi:hypothetical protein
VVVWPKRYFQVEKKSFYFLDFLAGNLFKKAPLVEDCEEMIIKAEVSRLERNYNTLWFEEDTTKEMPEYIEAKGKEISKNFHLFFRKCCKKRRSDFWRC